MPWTNASVKPPDVMYGNFLKRVDQRFQLEKTMKTLPGGLGGSKTSIEQIEETATYKAVSSHPETNLKAPDFKQKENGEALSKLPPLKKNPKRPLMANLDSKLLLDVFVPKGKLRQLKNIGEESWKKLVQNQGNRSNKVRSKKAKVIDEETSNSWKHLLESPNEWWDYRGKKTNKSVKPRHPDFKSKVGALSLWLNKAPDWVLPKLEGIEFDVQTQVIDEKTSNLWKHLLVSPNEWWDYRKSKANRSVRPKHPDFKFKDSAVSLWLNKAPDWVLPKLEGLEFDVFVPKREESWKDLVWNPDKWLDNRSKKINRKSPDFKHKETGEALWINNSPPWVKKKLPPLKKKKQERIHHVFIVI